MYLRGTTYSIITFYNPFIRDEMKMGIRVMGMLQEEITEGTRNNTWTNLDGTAKPIKPNQPGFLVIFLNHCSYYNITCKLVF